MFPICPEYFQKGFEVVPHIFQVEDPGTQWLLVWIYRLQCTSLYASTCTSFREAHSSNFYQGRGLINGQLLLNIRVIWQIIFGWSFETSFYLLQVTPKYKVEIKGCPAATNKSTIISQHLQIVEVKCGLVDEQVLKILNFFGTFDICKKTANTGFPLHFYVL